MRLVVLAVGVWAGLVALFALSVWVGRRLRRQYKVHDDAPVSDRWLADHVRDTSGDHS